MKSLFFILGSGTSEGIAWWAGLGCAQYSLGLGWVGSALIPLGLIHWNAWL